MRDGRNLRRLRAECVALIDGVEIPIPFDLRTFCDHLAERRKRPIHLLPLALPADSASGVWVSTSSADYIFYESDTAPLHQEHIVLHEIGHMLWEHRAASALGDDLARLLLPALAPQAIERILGRSHCAGLEEQQAELTASLILQRVAQQPAEPAAPVPAEDLETVNRLRYTLEAAVPGPAATPAQVPTRDAEGTT